MAWSDNLNNESPAFDIAASTSNRLRVVAGPGTGKSFAMKRRVARLLEYGVSPDLILPVTFTRVAAEDLHRELVNMGVAGCETLKATTLHSLGLRILMRAHALVSTGRIPRPLNDFEKKPLESDLKGFGGLREVRKKINAFEAAWARLQSDEPGHVISADDTAFHHALMSWLNFHRAMLIGEVIPELLAYLRANPAAPELGEFSHILVDEYQDLNKAEQEVIELLSGGSDVCIVGDDDQSIYSFRHAHPQGILEWSAALVPTPEDIELSVCYRCPTRVVAMANSLIANNVNRGHNRQLQPRAENGPGDVQILQYNDIDAEVAGVTAIVVDLVAEGVHPGDILILAQRGAIGTPIYESLIAENLPVKSYYAEAELESEFAQESFALLKLLVDQDDRVALRWLVGLNGSSWHEAGYRRIRQHCQNTGLDPWQVFVALEAGEITIAYSAGVLQRFAVVRGRLEALQEQLELAGIIAIVDDLFPETEDRVREVRRLMLNILEENTEITKEEFLSALNEAINKPEIPDEVQDVRIMSLHKSKGLSAPVTIISGCVEGLLPRQPSGDLTPNEVLAEIEEQRRLFFVGMSRVKADLENDYPGMLKLTYSREMPLATAMQSGITPAQVNYGTAILNASRFLNEFAGHAPPPQLG